MKNKEIYDLIETGNVSKKLAEIKDKTVLGEIYYKLGNIYCRSYGDIDQSDYYYKMAYEIFVELNNVEKIIHTIRDIAVNFELKGEYDKALAEFEKCLQKSKEENYELGIVLAFGGIRLLYHHLGDATNSRIIAINEEVKQLAQKLNSKLLKDASLLGDALMIEQSSRLKDQIKAQEILENLVQNCKYPIIKWSSTRFLIYNYLNEFLTTKNSELLGTIWNLISSLKQTINPTTDSPPSDNIIVKIRITILEAKLRMVEGDLETSQAILTDMYDELQYLHKSTVLIRLEEEINLELDNLASEYAKWKELIDKNTSFGEIVEKMNINEYLLRAQKLLKDELILK